MAKTLTDNLKIIIIWAAIKGFPVYPSLHPKTAALRTWNAEKTSNQLHTVRAAHLHQLHKTRCPRRCSPRRAFCWVHLGGKTIVVYQGLVQSPSDVSGRTPTGHRQGWDLGIDENPRQVEPHAIHVVNVGYLLQLMGGGGGLLGGSGVGGVVGFAVGRSSGTLFFTLRLNNWEEAITNALDY